MTNPQILIRELRGDDMESLAALYRQFWGDESDIPKMREKISKLRENKAYIFLGAEINGELAGSVMGVVCEELYGDCLPFLLVENMVVDSGFRRLGIGKKLFAELEKRARDMGCTQVILVTETDREDACGFYESIGFPPDANKGYKKDL